MRRDRCGPLIIPSQAAPAYQTGTSIAGTVDEALYQTERFCPSCSYSITVPNGNYEVVLHFAEIWWPSANQRVFDVSIEGTLVIDNLDISAKVGSFTALVQTFPATVSDGTLDVSLVASTDHATIEAIEVRLAGWGHRRRPLWLRPRCRRARST